MKFNIPLKVPVWPILLFLIVNSLLLITPPSSILRVIATLFMLFFIPGWVWLQFFLVRPLILRSRLNR